MHLCMEATLYDAATRWLETGYDSTHDSMGPEVEKNVNIWLLVIVLEYQLFQFVRKELSIRRKNLAAILIPWTNFTDTMIALFGGNSWTMIARKNIQNLRVEVISSGDLKEKAENQSFQSSIYWFSFGTLFFKILRDEGLVGLLQHIQLFFSGSSFLLGRANNFMSILFIFFFSFVPLLIISMQTFTLWPQSKRQGETNHRMVDIACYSEKAPYIGFPMDS